MSFFSHVKAGNSSIKSVISLEHRSNVLFNSNNWRDYHNRYCPALEFENDDDVRLVVPRVRSRSPKRCGGNIGAVAADVEPVVAEGVNPSASVEYPIVFNRYEASLVHCMILELLDTDVLRRSWTQLFGTFQDFRTSILTLNRKRY